MVPRPALVAAGRPGPGQPTCPVLASRAVVARRDGQIVGAAHCYRFESSARGDVSVAVDDRYQRQGLGPLLLERLVRLARDRGISVLEADVLAENRRMLGILARAHLPMTSALDMGVVHVEIFLEER